MIKLLAEHVSGLMLAGNVCPITGKYKEPGFRVSDEALKIYPEAGKAVDAILSAYKLLDNGHRIALNGFDKRKRVFAPILCQVKVAKDAEMCYSGNGVKPFLAYSYGVRGGRIMASVFGASKYDIDKWICVLAELKFRKTSTGEEYPYMRFQEIKWPVVSDVKLDIKLDDPKFNVLEFVDSLPCKVVDHFVGGEIGQDRYLYFAVGFSYIF
ncbi:hypothetical protein KAR28_00345 [Candidatus Parcubacteria bacterium]|nr:hypothetical protein [Candidatus Parcubacteria bacterium]